MSTASPAFITPFHRVNTASPACITLVDANSSRRRMAPCVTSVSSSILCPREVTSVGRAVSTAGDPSHRLLLSQPPSRTPTPHPSRTCPQPATHHTVFSNFEVLVTLHTTLRENLHPAATERDDTARGLIIAKAFLQLAPFFKMYGVPSAPSDGSVPTPRPRHAHAAPTPRSRRRAGTPSTQRAMPTCRRRSKSRARRIT